MKLAISNIGWDAKDDEKIYRLMKKYGFTGLEIAPTRLFPNSPYDILSKAEIWSNVLREKDGFSVPSMQSIWYGRKEKLFGSAEDRRILVEYTRKAIDFAAVIGCRNLVFGSPQNRYLPEGADILLASSFFKELGDYAFSKETCISMEANPLIYNTNYINSTEDAFELVEQVSSKGFKVNLDVGTMIQNREDVSEIVSRVNLINHVHISEPGLKPIEQRELHSDLRDVLVKENYQGFVSIEMSRVGDVSVLEEKMRYVGEIFG